MNASSMNDGPSAVENTESRILGLPSPVLPSVINASLTTSHTVTLPLKWFITPLM